MSLGGAFRDDPEAVARVTALLKRLKKEGEPHSARFSEVLKQLEADPDAALSRADLGVVWLAGRESGVREVIQALFGHDHVTFHPEPLWFTDEPDNLDWWNQLLGRDD